MVLLCFSVIFVWDKKAFLSYFFEFVELVYHGSSHAILCMFNACLTHYLQPSADTQLTNTNL